MATFTIEPERRTLHGVFSRELEPVLTIDSGDTVVYRTLDAGWNLEQRTSMINITGQPAISLPLYQSADGLPLGSHFVGRFGDEATLLRLARQLEEAQPWIDRKPPVSM